MTFVSLHISVSIERPADEVYEFVANPENVPRWASGLGGSIRHVDGDWVAPSPMGEIKIRFADKNRLGVLDHYVTLPAGDTVYNPMRVFPNDRGCELVFTLYRRPEMSDEALADDAKTVQRDLETLKGLVEG
jgi:hypothetical protein